MNVSAVNATFVNVQPKRWGDLSSPVVDDNDVLVITVTHDDIKHGVAHSSYHCAIARAATRITGARCQFGYELILWDNKFPYLNPFIRYYNPEANNWADNFDQNKETVAPERFVFHRVVSRVKKLSPPE